MTTLSGKRSLLIPQQGHVVAPATTSSLHRDSMLVAGASEAAVLPEPMVSGSGGGILYQVELYRATIDNELVEDISAYLFDGYVDLNVDRAIKLAATFHLHEPDVVTPYTDYLAPFVRLTYDDGTPQVYRQLGLFRVTVPPGTYTTKDAVAVFAGDDLTAVLGSTYYTDTINTPASTNYATEIVGGITNGGISRTNIPATSATTPTAQSFPIGTSRLEKANVLLDQLGWYHLGMDLDGRVSTPGAVRDLRTVEPYRTLTDTDLKAPMSVQVPGSPPYNVVIVINDDATAAPLYGIARNDDPASPTSTANIGEQMREPIKIQGSTTQDAVDAQAARYLSESRTYYRTTTTTILPDPDALTPFQTVDLALTGKQAGLSGRWRIRTARMGFTPASAGVALELAQVTDDVNGVTI